MTTEISAEQWEESLAQSLHTIKIAPPQFSGVAHAQCAMALRFLGRLDEALAHAERACELMPDTSFAHVERGSILSLLGRLDEALIAAEHAMKLPYPGHGHALRCGVLVQLRRFEEAVAACDAALTWVAEEDQDWSDTDGYLRNLRDEEWFINKRIEVLRELGRSDNKLKKKARRKRDNSAVVESNNPSYRSNMDQAARLQAAAEILRGAFPEERISGAFQYLVADDASDAARETTERATLPLRVAVKEDKTLGRLQQRYEEQLAAIELPADGFTTREQSNAAGTLSATYHRLSARQRERRVEVTPKDPRVKEAERMRSAFDRAKTNQAVRPVGRPRKNMSDKNLIAQNR